MTERELQILRLIRLTLLVFAVVFIARNSAIDPDLWGHVRFGRDIVAMGSVHSVDPYSFTSDRPWINHEWLAELVMYAAYAVGGGTGLIALKMLIVLGVVACVAVVLGGRGWRPVDYDFLMVVLLSGTMARWQPIRPQLFSLLLFALLLLVLTIADRGRPRVLLALPPLFAAWANLHGGYIVGLTVVAVWFGVRALQTPRRLLSLLGVGVASALATVLTPYGVVLWQFLWQTVSFSRPEIADWAPMYARPGELTLYLIVLGTAVTALWRNRAQVDRVALAVVVLLGVSAFRLSRVDAFFVIAVVMLLGPYFGRGVVAVVAVPWRRWSLAVAAVIVLSGAALVSQGAACLGLEPSVPKGVLQYVVDARRLMTEPPEAGAAAVLRQLRGRMLSFFDWGQYAIWHFPALQVSMDGRRETVYSQAVVDAHFNFYRDADTSLVTQLRPDVIWLPRALPVVRVLRQEGWHPAFSGPVSVVLVRQPVTAVEQVTDSFGPRCFPAE